jgi:hypothetical protein
MARPIPLKVVNPAPKLTECTECARCCTYVAVPVASPDNLKDATSILWMLYHDKVSVYLDSDDDWCVVFETRCKNLRSDLKCGIYETRPHVCRDFDNLTCEVNSVRDGREFYTPEEFLSWLKLERPRLHRAVAKDYLPAALQSAR